SRRMGLFVVGRLAARHGVRVRLRHAQAGGLTALIWLPDTVAAPEVAPPLGRLRRFEAEDFGPTPSLSAPPATTPSAAASQATAPAAPPPGAPPQAPGGGGTPGVPAARAPPPRGPRRSRRAVLHPGRQRRVARGAGPRPGRTGRSPGTGSGRAQPAGPAPGRG